MTFQQLLQRWPLTEKRRLAIATNRLAGSALSGADAIEKVLNDEIRSCVPEHKQISVPWTLSMTRDESALQIQFPRMNWERREKLSPRTVSQSARTGDFNWDRVRAIAQERFAWKKVFIDQRNAERAEEKQKERQRLEIEKAVMAITGKNDDIDVIDYGTCQLRLPITSIHQAEQVVRAWRDSRTTSHKPA